MYHQFKMIFERQFIINCYSKSTYRINVFNSFFIDVNMFFCSKVYFSQKMIDLVFSVLIANLFLINHWLHFINWHLCFITTFSAIAEVSITVLSAKIMILDSRLVKLSKSCLLLKSFIYIMKSRGSSTKPWGTPKSTKAVLETTFAVWTNWERLVRYHLSVLKTWPLKPIL